MVPGPLRIEIDGRAATAEQLSVPALVNYGHFTGMQVQGGRTRGLELHLARLEAATDELFGVRLDRDRVRALIAHALEADGDACVRVDVRDALDSDGVSVMVTVRPPADLPPTPQRLLSVHHERPLPHLKHVGTFGLFHHGLQAERAGFDDALLVGPDGEIREGAIANVGFFDGVEVVWPDGPMLEGVTMRLLERALAAEGLRSRRAGVRLGDLGSFDAAFLTNSLGIAPLAAVDDTRLPADERFMQRVWRAYDAVPAEAVDGDRHWSPSRR